MLAGLLLGFTGFLAGQVTPTPATSLLVLAKEDRMLAIVDPVSLQVVARIPVGPEPHEVIASDDGRTAWVTNYLNGSDHTITVVDLIGQKVVKTVDLGALWGPHGLYVAGGRVYFTAERAKVVGRLDPATETVDWVLGTGQIGTHMLWVSRDGKKMVTVNVGSGTMSLLRPERRHAGGRVPGEAFKAGRSYEARRVRHAGLERARRYGGNLSGRVRCAGGCGREPADDLGSECGGGNDFRGGLCECGGLEDNRFWPRHEDGKSAAVYAGWEAGDRFAAKKWQCGGVGCSDGQGCQGASGGDGIGRSADRPGW